MKKLVTQYKTLFIPFIEVFSKAISFANVLLLMAILPIEDYADYSYIIAIVLWASVLMDGGINSLIYNKSLKKDKEGINELYSGRFFLSILIILLIALFFYYKNSTLVFAAFVYAFVTYFSSTSALVKMLSRGWGYSRVDMVAIIVEPLLRLVVLLALFVIKDKYPLSLNTVLLWYLLSSFLAFIINRYKLLSYFKLHIVSLNSKRIFSLIIDSLLKSKYYLLYYLMFVGLARIDVIFIESVTNKEDLAVYSSAFNMYQVAQLFFFSIITSQFLNFYKNKNSILKIVIPLTVLAVFVTVFLSPFIYQYLFKSAYLNGQFVLNILIVAIIPSVLNYYFITKNNYENKVLSNFIILSLIFFTKTIVYFVINSALISFYAYGIIVSELVLLLVFIIYPYFYKRSTISQ